MLHIKKYYSRFIRNEQITTHHLKKHATHHTKVTQHKQTTVDHIFKKNLHTSKKRTTEHTLKILQIIISQKNLHHKNLYTSYHKKNDVPHIIKNDIPHII